MEISELLMKNFGEISEKQISQFILYHDMLIDWNANRCNLTAVTDTEGVVEKHFADSCLASKLIPQHALCIDVGTGAGFPGVPLKIMRPDIKIVLVDSLKKRVDFLEELVGALGVEAQCIHARAEDAGRDGRLREHFDIALTRAVSQTNILLEWTSPFLKVGGKSLMYKSRAAEDELLSCDRALSVLGMTVSTESFDVPWGERVIVCAEKLKKTPPAYPRKAGTAKKKPL